jgi:hypothetical protein
MTTVKEEPVSDCLPPIERSACDDCLPVAGLGLVNLRDLWEYWELFYFLTWRDVKVRYKQTLLGAAWAIIQPFFTMVVFSLVFGRSAKVPLMADEWYSKNDPPNPGGALWR